MAIGRLLRRLREVSTGEELTTRQASVLARLGKGEASTASALAEIEGVRPQSMATTIAALENLGLVVRSPDPGDGRRQLVSLTEAGLEAERGNRDARNEWLTRTIEDELSEADRADAVGRRADPRTAGPYMTSPDETARGTRPVRGGPAVTVTQARTDRFDRRLLPPMMLGAILNPINSSIIAVALVPIGTALGAPASQTVWLVSALYLATSIGQPLAGRLVDSIGPRRMFLIGASLTGVAGVVGTVAPSLGVLIVARVVLGFGTCAGYPAAMYLIRSEARRTGMASPAGVLTALSVTTQTIAVIGPTLGGLLISVGGWRATFAINIPLALGCLVLGGLVLPRTVPIARESGSRFDIIGLVLFGATLTSLLLFLMNLHVALLWLLAVAVVMGAAFTRWELRAADPFIDVRVFAGNVPLLITYARSVLVAVVSYSFLYGFTQWVEDGRGLSPSQAGLVLLPTFAVGIVVATTTGPRPQIRGKLIVGAATQIVACTLLLFVHSATPVVFLLAHRGRSGHSPRALQSRRAEHALSPGGSGPDRGVLGTVADLHVPRGDDRGSSDRSVLRRHRRHRWAALAGDRHDHRRGTAAVDHPDRSLPGPRRPAGDGPTGPGRPPNADGRFGRQRTADSDAPRWASCAPTRPYHACACAENACAVGPSPIKSCTSARPSAARARSYQRSSCSARTSA